MVKRPARRSLPTCSSRAILPAMDVEGLWKVGRPELRLICWGMESASMEAGARSKVERSDERRYRAGDMIAKGYTNTRTETLAHFLSLSLLLH